MANVATFTTIGTLRANASTTLSVAYIQGYYAALDGGGGTFVLNASDGSTADNGGTIIVDSQGQRWYREVEGTISIKWFGAKVDGVTDDSSAIQTAITWMQGGGHDAYAGDGGILYFPPGTTLINDGITIARGGITLQGMGWEEYFGLQGSSTPGVIGSHGSFILTTVTSGSPITITATANHCAIKDLAFSQTQPADTVGWTPTVYPPTIYIAGNAAAGGAVLLERLFAWNCYSFIQAGDTGNAVGRTTMKHIWGMPLNTGITIKFAADTVQIDDVHFWQFDQNVPNIIAWIQAHGAGIRSIRNDNPLISNIFIFGYNVGIQFSGSTDGCTARCHGSNIDLDSVNVGIQYLSISSGSPPSAQFVNLAHQCPGNGTSGIANNAALRIEAGAAGVFVDICNFRSTFSGGSVIAINNTTADVAVTNLWAENWNTSNTGAPIVSVPGGLTTVTLSGRLRQSGGHGAALSNMPINSSHVN